MQDLGDNLYLMIHYNILWKQLLNLSMMLGLNMRRFSWMYKHS